jgi:hypothetical protein
MKRKKSKMKKLIILTFFTILAFFLLISTYGVFESILLREVGFDIAAWEVEVNGSKVTNEEKDFTIDDIIWEKSDNVVNGKVAPGIEGYFDIVIDPKDTDVSIKYEIEYDSEHLKNINPAFKITRVEEINDNKLYLTSESTYAGIIKLNDIKLNKTHTIRTYIKWEDIEENNENNYILGSSNILFELPVDVNVIQYLDEEIVEYINGD